MGDSEAISDEELARRAAEGDQQALSTLYERHLPRLRARVRRRLPTVLRARLAESDLVQEGWLATAGGMPRFRDQGTGSFGRWLQGIVDNKIREQIRNHLYTFRRDARRERAPTEDAPSSPGHEPTPSMALSAREDRDGLARALAALPDRYRELLHLVHGEGSSLVDAGEKLGITANAARKVYGRAVGMLGDLMAKQEPPS